MQNADEKDVIRISTDTGVTAWTRVADKDDSVSPLNPLELNPTSTPQPQYCFVIFV